MKLQAIRQKQDEEKKKLIELRTLLRSTPDFDRVEVSGTIITIRSNVIEVSYPNRTSLPIRVQRIVSTSFRATRTMA